MQVSKHAAPTMNTGIVRRDGNYEVEFGLTALGAEPCPGSLLSSPMKIPYSF